MYWKYYVITKRQPFLVWELPLMECPQYPPLFLANMWHGFLLWCNSIIYLIIDWLIRAVLFALFSRWCIGTILWARSANFFSPGSALDGVSTIVCPSSWPKCDINFFCDAIASSPSSLTGVLAPSFSYYFIKDVSDVFCESKSPIVFCAGSDIYGVSTIVIVWNLRVAHGPLTCFHWYQKIWLFFLWVKQ